MLSSLALYSNLEQMILSVKFFQLQFLHQRSIFQISDNRYVSISIVQMYFWLACCCQCGAVQFQIIIALFQQQMLFPQEQLDQYYSYNSIVTVNGKRIRRLRRTEVSSQKLAIARYKSPNDSRSIASKRQNLRNNKSTDGPLTHSRSKLMSRCSNLLQGLQQREKNNNSQYQSHGQGFSHNFSLGADSFKGNKIEGNAKNKVAEYYLGGSSFEEKHKMSKKRSLSRRQSRDTDHPQPCPENPAASNSMQNSDYLLSPPNIPKPKIKRIKKAPEPEPQSISKVQQIDDYALNVVVQRMPSSLSLKEMVKSKSQSRIKVSKTNSKISQRSRLTLKGGQGEKSQKQSRISIEAQLSNETSQKDIVAGSYKPLEYEAFDQSSQMTSKSSSQLQRSSFNNSALSSKKAAEPLSSRHEASKTSKLSKLSKASSLAENIRSKMQSRHASKIASRLSSRMSSKLSSKLSKQSQDQHVSAKNSSSQFSHQNIQPSKIQQIMKEPSNLKSSQKSGSRGEVTFQVEETPKMSKREDFGLVEAKLKKQETRNTKNTDRDSFQSSRALKKSVEHPKPQQSNDESLETIMRKIDQHDIRLGFLYLLVDSMHAAYPTPIIFERYERLCFLMLKKYLYEKNRLVKTLEGKDNCLILTDLQVSTKVLQKYLSSPQIKQKLQSLKEEVKQIFRQVDQDFRKIQSKYRKDKLVKLQGPRDNFSKQIMKLLMQQLTKLYQQLQAEEDQDQEAQSSQRRIIDTIEIMFLISELAGRPVKPFQLMDDAEVDFDQYYGENYQRIMETTEYFQKCKE